MDDKINRDQLVVKLDWIRESCGKVMHDLKQCNPDVSLVDVSSTLDLVMMPMTALMDTCYGDGEEN